MFRIIDQMFQEYRCESGIAVLALRVICIYAYSPFNVLDPCLQNEYVSTKHQHYLADIMYIFEHFIRNELDDLIRFRIDTFFTKIYIIAV